MSSIVTKLARAAFTVRPAAVGSGRLAAPILISPAEAIRMCTAECPSFGEERASSKSEVAPHPTLLNPYPQFDENVFKSKEAMWAFYEYWCKFYGISRDRREMTRRFKIFSDNARRVHEFNNGRPGDCRMAMNPFSDNTKEEWSARLAYRSARLAYRSAKK